MALPGVRVGPLDPDVTAEFGQVSGKTSARQLIRHHVAMNPPALIGALTRTRNDARSNVLDRDEVTAAVQAAWDAARGKTPENFELTGCSVRGNEDAEQVVTFTWRVPVEAGGSGRTGKGFIPYDAETLPESVANGDEAVRIEKLREAGLPWAPSERALAAAGISGTGVEGAPAEKPAKASKADAALSEERDRLAAEVEDLKAQLAEAGVEPEEDDEPADENGDGDGEEADGEPTEPWAGYDESNAAKIKAYLRDAEGDAKVAAADAVLKYEPRHGKRSSVLAAANAIADRKPA